MPPNGHTASADLHWQGYAIVRCDLSFWPTENPALDSSKHKTANENTHRAKTVTNLRDSEMLTKRTNCIMKNTESICTFERDFLQQESTTD